jgi:hypothetical protein
MYIRDSLYKVFFGQDRLRQSSSTRVYTSIKAVLSKHEGMGQKTYRYPIMPGYTGEGSLGSAHFFRIHYTVCVLFSFGIWPVQNEVSL